MKKLLVLLFSILISFNSYGEWVKVASSKSGDIYSIDKNTIKEHNGFIYWYEMNNYNKYRYDMATHVVPEMSSLCGIEIANKINLMCNPCSCIFLGKSHIEGVASSLGSSSVR